MSSPFESRPPQWFEAEVEKALADVGKDWDSILTDIQRFGIGQGQARESGGDEKMIHVITKRNDRWMIPDWSALIAAERWKSRR